MFLSFSYWILKKLFDLQGRIWGGGVLGLTDPRGGDTPPPRILEGVYPPIEFPGGGHPPLKQWYFANYKDIFDNKKSLFTH